MLKDPGKHISSALPPWTRRLARSIFTLTTLSTSLTVVHTQRAGLKSRRDTDLHSGVNLNKFCQTQRSAFHLWSERNAPAEKPCAAEKNRTAPRSLALCDMPENLFFRFQGCTRLFRVTASHLPDLNCSSVSYNKRTRPRSCLRELHTHPRQPRDDNVNSKQRLII